MVTLAVHFIHCRDTSNDNQIIGQCCYDSKDILLTTVTSGGRDIKDDPRKRYFEHYAKDLWPIIICCEDLRLPDSTCQRILNDQQLYFKRSLAQGYAPPDYGSKSYYLCMLSLVQYLS